MAHFPQQTVSLEANSHIMMCVGEIPIIRYYKHVRMIIRSYKIISYYYTSLHIILSYAKHLKVP